MNTNNFFNNIPVNFPEEIVDKIHSSKYIRIERIISKGQSSPKTFWYDQNENEWVMLLRGRAKIEFENKFVVELNEGDFLNIPSHVKHRVEWTDPEIVTVWLAVFY